MRLHQYPPARTPAGHERGKTYREADLNAACEAGRQEGYKAGLVEGRAAGAAAAKARIADILKCPEAGGRPELARHIALETGMPVEPARQFLRVSPFTPNAVIPSIAEREAGQATLADGPPPAAETPVCRAWAQALKSVNGSRG